MLADNYLRFYFRFVRPNLAIIAQELYTEVEQRISNQLRAFIGMTAFEDIWRAWLLLQARQGNLPFSVEQVGSHWDKQVQVDAVAIIIAIDRQRIFRKRIPHGQTHHHREVTGGVTVPS